MAFAKQMEKNGAGEIIINSIDKDGTMSGYDLMLIQSISSVLTIPVVAAGGASSTEDFKLAINCFASAAAAGSLFVYHGARNAVLISYPSISEIKRIFS